VISLRDGQIYKNLKGLGLRPWESFLLHTKVSGRRAEVTPL